MTLFLHLLYCELVDSQQPLNDLVCVVRIELCLMSGNLVENDHIYLSLHLLYCELVHSVGKLPLNEHVCVLRIEVHHDNLVDNDPSFFLYCELVHSVGKLPLNEHVCVLRIEICVRNDNNYGSHLSLLHLLYCGTGALSR